jgi:hypothetical protein
MQLLPLLPALAAAARLVGIVSYMQNYQGCCKRDVLFCYDLELPAAGLYQVESS